MMQPLLRFPWAFCCLLAASVVSPGLTFADEADDQYAVAAGLYERQSWELAIEQFSKFLAEHPEHPKTDQSVFFLGEAQLQLGQLEKAEQRFREYLRRQPEGRFAQPALFRAGESAYLQDRFDEAKTDLAAFHRQYPDDQLNAYVLPYLGDIALEAKNYDAAVEHFRQALSEFPEGRLQDDCRFGLARALDKKGNDEEAARLYLAVAGKTTSPLADDAQFHLGALQYGQGKYAEAVDTFSAFQDRLTESSWRDSAHLGRGWSLLKLEKLNEAKQAFAAVDEDSKVSVEAKYWLGLTQAAEEQWAEAAQTLLAAAELAVEKDPKHKLAAAVRFQAGDALLRAGEPAKAIAQFDLSLQADPTASEESGAENWADDALRGKLQAALALNDHAAVDAGAAAFAERFPESPLADDAKRLLARSLLERKQFTAALELLKPLVESRGDGTAATDQQAAAPLEDRYLLGLAYAGLDRHEAVLTALEPVLAGAKPPLKTEAKLAAASSLVALKRYAEAIAPLEAVLSAKPDPEDKLKAQAQLAICYAREKRIDDAKRIFNAFAQAHAENPLFAPTIEQLADAAYVGGDTAWSEELFAKLAEGGADPKMSVSGLSGLGWSQFKSGKLEDAAATFDKLLQREPPPEMAAEATLVRGRILEELDQPEAALAMYQQLIGNYPDSPQHASGLLAAARLHHKLQQNEQAEALYAKLVESYPELPKLDTALYEWSWVLEDLGKIEESSQRLLRIRKEFAASELWPDALYRLTERAFEAKDYARAESLAAELLRANPPEDIRAWTLYLQGQIAAVQEKWDEVTPPLEVLVKEFPENPMRLQAEYWLAEAVYRQQHYDAAQEMFDALARKIQGHDKRWMAMVPLRRAQILAHQKKWNEALAIAQQIEKDFPEFSQQYEADYLIGRCLASQADFEGAREAYRQVTRSPQGGKTETAAMAQWMIGESYFHQKNYQAALRAYLSLEILYAYPRWQAAALLQAAKCHELLGEWSEAIKLYSRLLQNYPDTTFAEDASERLREAKQQLAGGAASEPTAVDAAAPPREVGPE